MARSLLVTTLALALLLMPGSARAEEDEAEKLVVRIHDASDLSARVPGLASALAEMLPTAHVHVHGHGHGHEQQAGMLVVKATPGVQKDLAVVLVGLRRDLGPTPESDDETDRVRKALAGARATAETLGRLRSKTQSLDIVDASAQFVFQTLVSSCGVNAVLSPDAGQVLADMEVMFKAEDVTTRVMLNLLLEPLALVLEFEHGILRVRTSAEVAKSAFHYDKVEAGPGLHMPTEKEWERAAAGPSTDSADLKSLVQALHEEVRALREEVREVRKVLEEIRDR